MRGSQRSAHFTHNNLISQPLAWGQNWGQARSARKAGGPITWWWVCMCMCMRVWGAFSVAENILVWIHCLGIPYLKVTRQAGFRYWKQVLSQLQLQLVLGIENQVAEPVPVDQFNQNQTLLILSIFRNDYFLNSFPGPAGNCFRHIAVISDPL